MQRVLLSDLTSGMITAEDVFSMDNQLIVPKGIALTENLIARLSKSSLYPSGPTKQPPTQPPSCLISQVKSSLQQSLFAHPSERRKNMDIIFHCFIYCIFTWRIGQRDASSMKHAAIVNIFFLDVVLFL